MDYDIEDLDDCYKYLFSIKNDVDKLFKFQHEIFQKLKNFIDNERRILETGQLKASPILKKRMSLYRKLKEHTDEFLEYALRHEAETKKQRNRSLTFFSIFSLFLTISVVLYIVFQNSSSLNDIKYNEQELIEELQNKISNLTQDSEKDNVSNNKQLDLLVPFIPTISKSPDISYDFYNTKQKLFRMEVLFYEISSDFNLLRNDFYEYKSKSDISNLITSLDSIETDIDSLEKQFNTLETAIIDDPKEALSLPLFQKEIDYNNAYIGLLEKEVNHIKGWFQFLLFIILPIMLTLITFNIVHLLKEKKYKNVSEDGQIRNDKDFKELLLKELKELNNLYDQQLDEIKEPETVS